MAQSRKSFWGLVVGMVAVGVVAVIALDSEKKPPVASKPAPLGSSAKRLTQPQYDPDLKFSTVNLSQKNAFKPLIVRRQGGVSGQIMGDPSALPPALAGGETGWYFTGITELDGSKSVLIENRSTGEGDYLQTGQAWKALRVVRIGEQGVVVEGPNGEFVTLRLNDGSTMMEGTIEGELGPAQVDGPIQGLNAVPDGSQRTQGGGPPTPFPEQVVIEDED